MFKPIPSFTSLSLFLSFSLSFLTCLHLDSPFTNKSAFITAYPASYPSTVQISAPLAPRRSARSLDSAREPESSLIPLWLPPLQKSPTTTSRHQLFISPLPFSPLSCISQAPSLPAPPQTHLHVESRQWPSFRGWLNPLSLS